MAGAAEQKGLESAAQIPSLEAGWEGEGRELGNQGNLRGSGALDRMEASRRPDSSPRSQIPQQNLQSCTRSAAPRARITMLPCVHHSSLNATSPGPTPARCVAASPSLWPCSPCHSPSASLGLWDTTGLQHTLQEGSFSPLLTVLCSSSQHGTCRPHRALACTHQNNAGTTKLTHEGWEQVGSRKRESNGRVQPK